MIRRREFLAGLGAIGTLAGLDGCAVARRPAATARVIVIGGGYAGTTAAKYLRMMSGYTLEVVLIEPGAQFISAPISNLVISGDLEVADITSSYDGLRRRHGVTLVRDRVTDIDLEGKTVRLEHASALRYDRLVLAPGIEPMFDAIPGLAAASAAGSVLQAWSAGPETVALHRQLLAMRDGGVFAITIPEAPYRCPPGPYERASVVAAFLKQHKPRSKVLVLDANQDVVALAPLFKQAWADLYGGLLEYRNHYAAVAVDGATRTVRFEVQEDVQADVLNVLPPVRAGTLAIRAGLANSNARWCQVDFLTFASTVSRDVHVLGDSIQAAPMMPKSGHMANSHAKVAAAAIVAELQGLEVDPKPAMTNTCYSYVNATEAFHSTTVYDYDVEGRIFKPVAGASGISASRSSLEGGYALAWAHNIWADMLA